MNKILRRDFYRRFRKNGFLIHVTQVLIWQSNSKNIKPSRFTAYRYYGRSKLTVFYGILKIRNTINSNNSLSEAI